MWMRGVALLNGPMNRDGEFPLCTPSRTDPGGHVWEIAGSLPVRRAHSGTRLCRGALLRPAGRGAGWLVAAPRPLSRYVRSLIRNMRHRDMVAASARPSRGKGNLL
jgi:hypothetical protein